MTNKPLLRLLNPNTNNATTAMMAAIANEVAGARGAFLGQTMTSGPAIITNEPALRAAAVQIIDAGLAAEREYFDGILISGFGDPGLAELKDRIAIPVTGIAEASMAEAGAQGRRFSIVTTTPHLRSAIISAAQRYGHDRNLASIRITAGDAEAIMSDAEALSQALLHLCVEAVGQDGAQAIIIGGGPLAAAARAISGELPVPIIEPVAAGARLALDRALSGTSPRKLAGGALD